MEMLIVFIIAFIILILFPFLLSLGVKFESKDATSLVVINNNVKDPRYFSKSFKKKLTNALIDNPNPRDVILSKIEEIVFWDEKYENVKAIDKICIFEKEADIDNKVKFMKEIYSKENIEITNRSSVRAIAGEKNVIVGEKSKVIRWVDAENLLVLKELSDAGISASSGERLVVEHGCTFKRLYSPIIEVRKYVGIIDEEPEEIVINRETPVYMKLLRDIKEVEERTTLNKTIITKHKLIIGYGATVCGDVKSDKDIYIRANSVVTGNVFADGNIIIEKGVKVFGNIFAGKNVYIGPDVQIGKVGRIKSVIARLSMLIAKGTIVYGYIGTELGGKIVDAEDFAAEVYMLEKVKIVESDIKPQDNYDCVICNYTKDGCVTFKSVEEFEDIDYYAFRDNVSIRYVVIPQGAKTIEPSMFYGCLSLETVYIPNTVEKIGEYAFYKCKKLKEVEFDKGTKLKEIGEYAFSECESLEEFNIEYVEKLEDAVFRNDINFRKFNVLDKSVEVEYGESVFQNCDKIEEV